MQLTKLGKIVAILLFIICCIAVFYNHKPLSVAVTIESKESKYDIDNVYYYEYQASTINNEIINFKSSRNYNIGEEVFISKKYLKNKQLKLLQ